MLPHRFSMVREADLAWQLNHSVRTVQLFALRRRPPRAKIGRPIFSNVEKHAEPMA